MNKKVNKLLLKDKNNYISLNLDAFYNENDFLNHAANCLKNGADVIEFDIKGLNSRQMLSISRKLRDLSGVFGALLIIKDRIDIAKLSDADGIVLDENSILPAEAIKLTEGNMLLGLYINDSVFPENSDPENTDFVVSNIYKNSSIKVFSRN